jgi:predicted esterase YcpF (UPF0227 family)
VTTLVYLHGFNSAPQSVKGQLLARAAAALPKPPRFYLPQLHHRPERAMREVCEWIERNVTPLNELTLIGSSLGGFYATFLAERYGARAVVINPAIAPHEDLRPYAGRQRNLYTGDEYDVTPAHFDELAALASSASPTRSGISCLCAQATSSSTGVGRSCSMRARINT